MLDDQANKEKGEYEEGVVVLDPGKQNAGEEPNKQVPDQGTPNVFLEEEEKIRSTDHGHDATEVTAEVCPDPNQFPAGLGDQRTQYSLEQGVTPEGMLPLETSQVCITSVFPPRLILILSLQLNSPQLTETKSI